MEKYTVETGLNTNGNPVIKCSKDYYNELVQECREMVRVSTEMGTLDIIARAYPAICLLATMPTVEEVFNAN